MSANPKNYYKKIEGLRAFAAVGIVLMHVQANMTLELHGFVFEKLIPSFTNNVFLFMVISGFATCCGYFERITKGQIKLEEFYKKRFLKTWPFFFLLNLMDIIMSPSRESLFEVLANLTLCFGFIPNHGIDVIGVGWFLGVVFVFYFLFPFFCYLLSNKKRAWFSLGISLLLNYLCVEYFNVGRTSIAYTAVFFILGGLIYLYRKELQCFAEQFHFIVLIAVVGTVGCYYYLSDGVLIKLLLCGFMVVYALRGKKNKIDLLDNKITTCISGVSMEVYLCHMVVFRLLELCVSKHLGNSINVLQFLVMAVGTILGAMLFAYIGKAFIAKCFMWINVRRLDEWQKN